MSPDADIDVSETANIVVTIEQGNNYLVDKSNRAISMRVIDNPNRNFPFVSISSNQFVVKGESAKINVSASISPIENIDVKLRVDNLSGNFVAPTSLGQRIVRLQPSQLLGVLAVETVIGNLPNGEGKFTVTILEGANYIRSSDSRKYMVTIVITEQIPVISLSASQDYYSNQGSTNENFSAQVYFQTDFRLTTELRISLNINTVSASDSPNSVGGYFNSLFKTQNQFDIHRDQENHGYASISINDDDVHRGTGEITVVLTDGNGYRAASNGKNIVKIKVVDDEKAPVFVGLSAPHYVIAGEPMRVAVFTSPPLRENESITLDLLQYVHSSTRLNHLSQHFSGRDIITTKHWIGFYSKFVVRGTNNFITIPTNVGTPTTEIETLSIQLIEGYGYNIGSGNSFVNFTFISESQIPSVHIDGLGSVTEGEFAKFSLTS